MTILMAGGEVSPRAVNARVTMRLTVARGATARR
jgi:hypothetical protein